MDGGAERKVAPPVETPVSSVSSSPWVRVLFGAGLVVLCAGIVLVFLVLTGIIAEPETVIEQVLRMLLGR
jgi:hypothetical protein